MVVRFSSIVIELEKGEVEEYHKRDDDAIAKIVKAVSEKLNGCTPVIENVEVL